MVQEINFVDQAIQSCNVDFINKANECLAVGWDYAALPKIKLTLILAAIGVAALFILDLYAIVRLKRLQRKMEAFNKPEDVVERDEWGNVIKK